MEASKRNANGGWLSAGDSVWLRILSIDEPVDRRRLADGWIQEKHMRHTTENVAGDRDPTMCLGRNLMIEVQRST